jgi:diguanylate cyclase (GGDEF)-like protein
MSPSAQASDHALLALERKRVLDFVWILTLAFQAALLLLLAWLGWIDGGVGSLGRNVVVCGVLFVVAADLSYRLQTERAIGLSSYANQAVGIGMLTWLWTLSGGAAAPGGLAFFAPPLLVSAMVGLPWMPRATLCMVLLSVWGAAWATTGDLPWHATWGAPDAPRESLRAGVLLFCSFAAVALTFTSTVLSRLLVRLYQRLRSHSDLGEEVRDTFEAVRRGASEPQAVVYADTFQLIHASDSFYRRMLLDPEEAAGRSLYNLVCFENRERMEAMLQEVSGVVPFQHVRVGPEPIVVNLRFDQVQRDGVRYTSLTFEEVTDLYHFRAAFDAMDDALLIVGDVGDLLYANRTAHDLFGDLYVGKPMLGVLRHHRLVSRAGLGGVRNLERIEVGGTPFHLSVMAPQASPGQGSRVFWLRCFTDEELDRDRESRDPLTGAHNRRAFERLLQHEVREVGPDAPLALSLWTIDDWKTLDEEIGPAAGSAALQAFAAILHDELRSTDTVCRLDGHEFGILHPGSDLAGAEAAVGRLMLALDRQAIALGRERRKLVASVGVTRCRQRESVASLVARADGALYAAKEGGGGCCIARDPDVDS